MKRLLIVALLCLSLTVTEAHAQKTMTGSGPQVFAQQIGQAQLEDMLSRALKNTATLRVLEKQYGQATVDKRMAREIKTVAAANQTAWNSNLATAYEGLLTTEEWKQVISKNPSPSLKAKFPNVLTTAGTRMQTLSDPMMKSMIADVMQGLLKEFPFKSAQ